MQIFFAHSAARHRISQERIRYVIEHCGLIGGQQPSAQSGSGGRATRLIYFGDDANGVPLEVMAIELRAGDLLVIHAMPLRGKYRQEYEEAKKWRR